MSNNAQCVLGGIRFGHYVPEIDQHIRDTQPNKIIVIY
jgi:hypothetical protein